MLDRVHHFQPIPIQYRYASRADVAQLTDRSKAADAAAATNNSGGAADPLGGCLWSVVDISCFSIVQIGFTFLVPADLGSPRERAVKRVCVYVYSKFSRVCNLEMYQIFWSISISSGCCIGVAGAWLGGRSRPPDQNFQSPVWGSSSTSGG